MDDTTDHNSQSGGNSITDFKYINQGRLPESGSAGEVSTSTAEYLCPVANVIMEPPRLNI